jgi:arsenate reductase
MKSNESVKKVLLICEHNSARSQMAEAFLNTLAGNRFFAQSAGLEPGVLNPLAILAMKEVEIDISHNKTKSVFEFVKRGDFFSYVITVCDEASAERCPIFPGITTRLHWNIGDPVSFTGTDEEKLNKTRKVRDDIRSHVERFIKEVK